MSVLRQLQERRAAVIAEARAMLDTAESESRDLTEDEATRFGEIEAESEALKGRIERQQRLREEERSLAQLVNAKDEITHVPQVEVTLDEADRPFRSFGEQLMAVRNAALGRGTDRRLEHRAATGAGEDVGADGGFLVQKDFSTEVMRRMFAGGQILSRVRQLGISAASNAISIPIVDETSRATGSRWGGVQGYWVDEGTAATGSRPRFGKIELKLKRVAALGYATEELMQDTAALDTIMMEAFSEELRFLAEDGIINGTGGGQPLGILNAGCLVSQAKESGQAADTVVYENVINARARLHARSRGQSVVLINQDVEPQLHTMSVAVGTGGVPVYLPANGAAGSPFSTLFGMPVIPVEYCPTVGDLGDLIFADLSQYAFATKGGVQTAASMHVQFTTHEMAFRATFRCDGAPLWNSALTPFKGSNTQSPFVAIAARA